MVLTLVLLIVCMAVFNIVSSVVLYTTRIKEERIHTATGAAEMAAALIDGNKVEDYLANGTKEPGYEAIHKEMCNIRDHAYGVEYLYALKLVDEGCCFIFDTDTDDVQANPPGTVVAFEEAFKPYLPALFAGKRIEPIESNDVSGWVITIYEPVYDRNGKCSSYVGVDISMTDVRDNIGEFLAWVVSGTIIFLLLVLLICWWLSHQYSKVSDAEEQLHKQQQDKVLLREIVTALVKTVDMKDQYTNGHSFRVAKYTAMLAEELGYDTETVEKYYDIALMHDIGKIGIPEEVLNKPGKLTDEEFATIKSHAKLGYDVLKDISIMPDLAEGAGCHHERPDGKGYPRGLKDGEIPRVAQIIAVADTFDAMYSNRPYRKRMNFDRVVSIIKEVSGTQLTEDVVDAFLRLVDKGKFRSLDDDGGGSVEDIDNIHKRFDEKEKSLNKSGDEQK